MNEEFFFRREWKKHFFFRERKSFDYFQLLPSGLDCLNETETKDVQFIANELFFLKAPKDLVENKKKPSSIFETSFSDKIQEELKKKPSNKTLFFTTQTHKHET